MTLTNCTINAAQAVILTSLNTLGVVLVGKLTTTFNSWVVYPGARLPLMIGSVATTVSLCASELFRQVRNHFNKTNDKHTNYVDFSVGSLVGSFVGLKVAHWYFPLASNLSGFKPVATLAAVLLTTKAIFDATVA